MRACGLGVESVLARMSDRPMLAALLGAWVVPGEGVSAAYAAIDKIERDPKDVLIERLQKAGLSNDVANNMLAAVSASDLTSLRREHGGDRQVAEALDRVEQYLA